MSAAARPLPQLGVYLVTDRTQTAGRPLLGVVEQALLGGVRAVQLREPDLSAHALLRLAQRMREITARHGALLLINDRIDVALACGADGVHLPARSFAVADARRLLGPRRRIGVSTHGIAEVRAAAHAGADFVVFGPVYDTPSKRPYGAPLGPAALGRAAAAAALPVVAIGGIDAERRGEILSRGAAGIAVVRAILAAPDPRKAARALTASRP